MRQFCYYKSSLPGVSIQHELILRSNVSFTVHGVVYIPTASDDADCPRAVQETWTQQMWL